MNTTLEILFAIVEYIFLENLHKVLLLLVLIITITYIINYAECSIYVNLPENIKQCAIHKSIFYEVLKYV